MLCNFERGRILWSVILWRERKRSPNLALIHSCSSSVNCKFDYLYIFVSICRIITFRKSKSICIIWKIMSKVIMLIIVLLFHGSYALMFMKIKSYISGDKKSWKATNDWNSLKSLWERYVLLLFHIVFYFSYNF